MGDLATEKQKTPTKNLFYKSHLTAYISMYVIKTYLLWEITNPIWWVIKLPNYTPDERLGILGGLLFYLAIISAITAIIKGYRENNFLIHRQKYE